MNLKTPIFATALFFSFSMLSFSFAMDDHLDTNDLNKNTSIVKNDFNKNRRRISEKKKPQVGKILEELVVPRIARDGADSHLYETLYENSKAAARWTGRLETASWFLKGVAVLTGTTSGIIGILDVVDKAHSPIATASLSFASTVLVVLDGICQKKIDSYHHANKDLEAFLDSKTKDISDDLSDSEKLNLSLLKSAITMRYNYLYKTRDEESLYLKEVYSIKDGNPNSESDLENCSIIETYN